MDSKEPSQRYYDLQLEHRSEILPLVVWLGVVLVAVMLCGAAWEALQPLLEYFGLVPPQLKGKL